MGSRVWTVVVASIALGACTSSGRTAAPRTDPHAAAVRTATRLAHQVVVPAGATPYAGALPRLLRAPFEYERTPNFVDTTRVWIVRQPSARVLDFERAHPPRGLIVAACCGTSTAPTERVDAITFEARGAYETTRPIANAQVLVEVESRTATTSYLRVDAQAVWRPNRDTATFVPATDRVITIVTDGHRKVVTTTATVDRIERAFNALPAAVPSVSHGCPAQAETLTLSFSTGAGAPPDVTAVLSCERFEVTAHGRHQELESSDALTALTG